MAKDTPPVTAAVRMLREHGIAFTHHAYTYEERGGTAVSARELDVPEHAVIKTLVLEDDAKHPLVVLMHGDREVSTKALARFLGVKSVTTCAPPVASRHSGYLVGDADLPGALDRRPALPLRQWRQARLPCRNGAGRADPRPATDRGRRRDRQKRMKSARPLAHVGDFA